MCIHYVKPGHGVLLKSKDEPVMSPFYCSVNKDRPPRNATSLEGQRVFNRRESRNPAYVAGFLVDHGWSLIPHHRMAFGQAATHHFHRVNTGFQRAYIDVVALAGHRSR